MGPTSASRTRSSPNNTATGGVGVGNCDVDGTFASSGGNLENTDSCNFNQITDLRNTVPGLGTQLANGGPTDTLALLAGSAAIGKASGCPATDQRGVGRPQGGACEIGAYEFAPPAATTGSTSARTTAGGTVSGSVLPNLRETSYHFDYGRTTSYGSSSADKSAGAGNAANAASQALSGTAANTTYHYRLVASMARAPRPAPIVRSRPRGSAARHSGRGRCASINGAALHCG